MSPQDDDLSLIFGLSTESRFFFKCQRCSVCCSNKAIEAGPYEILRLSRNLGVTTGTFLRTYCEDDGAVLRNRPDGRCIFLVPQGCGVHPDRPLVCRLYPLGVLWDAGGKERFSNMPPHPDCLGYLGDEGTVAGYLASQDVEPYLNYEKKYMAVLQQRQSEFANPGNLSWSGTDFAEALKSLLVDFDSTVSEFCQERGIGLPGDLNERVEIHLKMIKGRRDTQ